jgi:hypothetical protein
MKALLIENCSPRNPLFSYGAKNKEYCKLQFFLRIRKRKKKLFYVLVYFTGPNSESSNIESVLKLSLNLNLYVSFFGTLLKLGLAASPSKTTPAKLLLLDESLSKEL